MDKPILGLFSSKLKHEKDIDTYTSLRWRRKLYEPGEFELHLSASKAGMFRRGQIVLRDDRKEAGIINRIYIPRENEGTFVVSGRFLSIKLEDAAILGRYNFNATYEDVMRKLVSVEYNRIVPELPLILGSTNNFSDKIQTQISRKALLPTLVRLSKASNIGFMLRPNLKTGQLVFETYQGKDKSVNQSTNKHVIFSDIYDNISNPQWEEDDGLFKNYAVVLGEGEGDEREIVYVDRTNGDFRKEQIIDAKDLQMEEGQSISEYRQLLRQRGVENLNEYPVICSFNSEIKPTAQFKYLYHWDLGDVITGEWSERGKSMDQRITEVEEVYEGHSIKIEPVLGTPMPETFETGDDY